MKQAVASVVRAALAIEGKDAYQVEVSIVCVKGRVTFKSSRADRLDEEIRLEDIP